MTTTAGGPSLTGRQSARTACSRKSAAAAWASSTPREDSRLGRTVALKALAPEYTTDPIRRERLTREARAAAALSHPAVATVFALEEIEGELFLVSELVEGETLREELQRGRAQPARLLSIRSRISQRGLPPPTRPASSTAISSPRTSFAAPTATSRFSTSGWRE